VPISVYSAKFSDLLAIHLQKNPNSRIQDRKVHFNSFHDTFKEATLLQVNSYTLGIWFQHIKKVHNLSDRTLNTIKSDINCFFKDLVDQNILTNSPLDKIKFERRPQPRRKRIVLSVEEVKNVLNEAFIFSPKILYPFLFLCAHTGARRSEILKLKREDVDFSNKIIFFRNTKNGEDRGLRMGFSLFEFLKGQLNLQS
jgi:integrase